MYYLLVFALIMLVIFVVCLWYTLSARLRREDILKEYIHRWMGKGIELDNGIVMLDILDTDDLDKYITTDVSRYVRGDLTH